jgi:hypothetical protein
LQKLVKQFDDDFFQALGRLYQNEKTTSRARPQYYGKFINQYVCKPLENGYVKAELNKLNITEEGKRKAQFHQWLTKDSGIKLLARQIGRVQQAMDDSDSLEQVSFLMKKKLFLNQKTTYIMIATPPQKNLLKIFKRMM